MIGWLDAPSGLFGLRGSVATLQECFDKLGRYGHSGDFERIILGNITARAHFLVLLTPSALERCDDPGDWLRREIETALANQRNIVPLMLVHCLVNLFKK